VYNIVTTLTFVRRYLRTRVHMSIICIVFTTRRAQSALSSESHRESKWTRRRPRHIILYIPNDCIYHRVEHNNNNNNNIIIIFRFYTQLSVGTTHTHNIFALNRFSPHRSLSPRLYLETITAMFGSVTLYNMHIMVPII